MSARDSIAKLAQSAYVKTASGAASCAAVAPADRTAIVPTTVLASDNSAVFVRRMAPTWALTKTCHFATHL